MAPAAAVLAARAGFVAPAAARALAHAPIALSSTLTCSGEAPFCGPKTLAELLGPNNGLVTSATPYIFTPAKFFCKADKSMRFTRKRGSAPSGSSSPFLSYNFAPHAADIPAPPSLQATPPNPT